MIKCKKMENTDSNENSFTVSLFADTKEEVVPGAEIVGFPANATMEIGSTCMTAEGNFAFMKSDGIWNWIA